MGNMAFEQQRQLVLNLNLAILIACEITASILFVHITTLLNAVEKLPIITPAEALKQQNTYVMFKTRSILEHKQTQAQIQYPLRSMRSINDGRVRNQQQGQLIRSILRSKHLSEEEVQLYYRASRSFKKQASLNRFLIYRFMFRDFNIPTMYPTLRTNQSVDRFNSVFMSHNMVSLGKTNNKGEIRPLYTGFNRQFIRKTISRQRQIVIVQFFVGFAMFFLHLQQITNWQHWIRKKWISIFRNKNLRGGKKRRVQVSTEETCIICYVRPRDVIFRDCKHFVVCDDCLYDEGNKMLSCPICRRDKHQKIIRVQFKK